jgi:hypothetical protein
MNRTRVTPAEYAATMAALDRVLEELEETQEIARTSFEPDDPLEETQEIFPNAAITGTWEPMRRLTPCGEIVTLGRYRK